MPPKSYTPLKNHSRHPFKTATPAVQALYKAASSEPFDLEQFEGELAIVKQLGIRYEGAIRVAIIKTMFAGNFDAFSKLVINHPKLLPLKDEEGNTILHSYANAATRLELDAKYLKLLLETTPKPQKLVTIQNNYKQTVVDILVENRHPQLEEIQSLLSGESIHKVELLMMALEKSQRDDSTLSLLGGDEEDYEF